MFHVKFKSDYVTLTSEGIVSCENEWQSLWPMERFQQHNCHNAGERCLTRIDADGNRVCRVKKHPPCGHCWFEEHAGLWGEEALEALRKFDLVEGERAVHPDLRGGTQKRNTLFLRIRD